MSGQKLWRFWYCLNQRHEGLLFEETSKIIQKWNFITLILWQVFAKIICTKFKYNYTNVRLRNKKSFFIQICFGILFHLKFSLKNYAMHIFQTLFSRNCNLWISFVLSICYIVQEFYEIIGYLELVLANSFN